MIDISSTTFIRFSHCNSKDEDFLNINMSNCKNYESCKTIDCIYQFQIRDKFEVLLSNIPTISFKI